MIEFTESAGLATMVFSLQPTSDPSVAIGTIGAGLRWNSSFALLRSAVSAEKAAALLAAARSLSFEERPDSVDGLPSHELYVVKDGEIRVASLARRTQADLTLLTDLVNSHTPVCRGLCRPCTSLLRRYVPGERRAHPEHVDGHAAATAVVSLSRSGDYSGGFFVGDLRERALLPLGRGDAVLHAGDVLHGVDVRGGERWSWVVWFLSGPRCSLGDAVGWWQERAEAGQPFAQYLHARRLAHAHRRDSKLAAAASGWLRLSALDGFPLAMLGLGRAHAAAEGVPLDLRAAALWLGRAAAWRGEGGEGGGVSSLGGARVGARAAYELARLLLRGEENGWPSPLPVEEGSVRERARALLEQAAADGHASARELLEEDRVGDTCAPDEEPSPCVPVLLD